MSIVIDASVAVKWVLNEAGTDAALALRNEELIAPVLWLAEAANALWRHVRLGELAVEEAIARMTELEEAPVTSLAIEPLIRPALILGSQSNHPIYDCLYLALALRYDTHIVSDDRRFAAAVARLGLTERIRLLGT